MSKDPEVLQSEDGIVWTEDIKRLDYVRETLDTDVGTRRRPVPWRGPGRRVGYSVLKSNSPSGDTPGRFTRRVFWVKEHDRSEAPDGAYKTGAPSEGVDPQTVEPGVWGELTERALGGRHPAEAVRTEERRAKQGSRSRPSSTKSSASTDYTATEQGVKEAFADWLHLRDVSVPETIGAAVGEAFSRWLWANSQELRDAIADAIAKHASLPEPPTPEKET